MAHSNPVTAAVVQPHDAFHIGSRFIHPMATQSADVPKINATQEKQWDWRELPEDDPCWQYWKTKEDDAKKQVSVYLPPRPPSPVFPYDPHVDEDRPLTWSKCHLLSLPKDIRLKIWEHVLTDPSMPDLPIVIDREPFSPSYKHVRPPVPKLEFYHVKRRNPVSINILMANREVYEEALPILYGSVKFMPADVEGLLPLFLDTLSPFARSCIRKIYLCIREEVHAKTLRRDLSKPFFHWAVTCAQVAQLNGTLEQVEIDSNWSVFERPANRRAILFPLFKIKAKKRFMASGPGETDTHYYETEFRNVMVEAERELKAIAKLRAERTKADVLQQRERIDEKRRMLERNKDHEKPVEEHNVLSSMSPFKDPLENTLGPVTPVRERTDGTMEEWCRWAEDNLKRMEQDLSQVSGIKQFEKELEQHAQEDYDYLLEDWDLVTLNSGTSTPKAHPASVLSKDSDETWAGTISTIVSEDDIGKGKADKGDESDVESEGWEHVEL